METSNQNGRIKPIKHPTVRNLPHKEDIGLAKKASKVDYINKTPQGASIKELDGFDCVPGGEGDKTNYQKGFSQTDSHSSGNNSVWSAINQYNTLHYFIITCRKKLLTIYM